MDTWESEGAALEWEPPKQIDGNGCLAALALAVILWSAIIGAGVFVWRNL